jgi:hypothetical protein
MSLRVECIETTAFKAEQRRPKTRLQSTSVRLFAGVPAMRKRPPWQHLTIVWSPGQRQMYQMCPCDLLVE